MAINSEPTKKARLVLRKKLKEQPIENFSAFSNIEPDYQNLDDELPINLMDNSEPFEQNIDQDLNVSNMQEDLIANLEDQILSQIDKESSELAPTPFNMEA